MLKLLLPPSRTVRPDLELPPLERFTGTLYKAMDVATLTPTQRAWAMDRILIHDPEIGLVRADGAVSPPGAELVAEGTLILDLRSKEYARRALVPSGGWAVRVVSESGDDGRRLAISHWNKLHKGVFMGALIRARPRAETLSGFLRWSKRAGFRLERVTEGHLDLVIEA